jgi:hypothetical protein
MSIAAGVWGSLRSFRNSVSHRPVSTLALIPHPQQRRVTGIDEIDDAHIGLGGVLTMQTASVLLQRPFPRHRHRQHQGIEWRMIKTFANQFAGGQ